MREQKFGLDSHVYKKGLNQVLIQTFSKPYYISYFPSYALL